MRKILFNLIFFPTCLCIMCMEAKPYVYVGNYDDPGTGSISVIDVATNNIVSTIALTTYDSPYALAITPNGARLLATDFIHARLLTINPITNELVTTSVVGSQPEGLAVTPNGHYAYVACSGDDKIYVFNILTTPITALLSLTARNNPKLIAISPNGEHAYVTNQGPPASLSVIETSTNTIVYDIPFTLPAYGIAITPHGKYAYVTHPQSNYVSVVDLTTNTVINAITVGNAPFYVAITPNGKYAYVANEADNTVSVINLKSNITTKTISVGIAPRGVAITPDGKYVYITNYTANTVSVIQTSTNTVIATIPVGVNPFGLTISPSAGAFRLLEANGWSPITPLKGATP